MFRKKIGLLFFALFAFQYSYAQLYTNYDFNVFHRTSSDVQFYTKKVTGGAFSLGYKFKNYYGGISFKTFDYRMDYKKVKALIPYPLGADIIDFEDQSQSLNFGYFFHINEEFRILTRAGMGIYNLYINDYKYFTGNTEINVTHDEYKGHIYSLQTNAIYQVHPNFGFSGSVMLFRSGANGAYYVNGEKHNQRYKGNAIYCSLGFYFQFFNEQKEDSKVENETF